MAIRRTAFQFIYSNRQFSLKKNGRTVGDPENAGSLIEAQLKVLARLIAGSHGFAGAPRMECESGTWRFRFGTEPCPTEASFMILSDCRQITLWVDGSPIEAPHDIGDVVNVEAWQIAAFATIVARSHGRKLSRPETEGEKMLFKF